MDKLGEVGWAGFHLDTQAPPELDILVETGGEVDCGVIGSLGAGKGSLHGIEVPGGPQHSQVHRADLDDEVLQLLDLDAMLGGEYHQKGE